MYFRKTTALALVLILSFSLSFGQSTLPSKVFGTSNNYKNVEVSKTNAGDYIITNTIDATYDSLLVIKIDNNFNQIWSKSFGHTGRSVIAHSSFEKDNGNILIATTYLLNNLNSDNSTTNLIELDPSGNLIGMTKLGDKHERLKFFEKTNDGNFINYGDLEGLLTGSNIWNCASFIKYDMTTGIALLNKFYNYNPTGIGSPLGEIYMQAMSESLDDSLYFLADRGYSSPTTLKEIRVINTDINGNLNWVKGYSTGKKDRSKGIVIDADKNNYILGYTNGFGTVNDTSIFILKIDKNGIVKWVKSYSNPNNGLYASKIIDTGNNKLAVLGYSTNALGGIGNQDVFFMELDTAGNLQWAKVYGGPVNEQGTSLNSHPNGYLIAGTSNSWGTGNRDIYLINTDINGNVSDTCTADVTSLITVTNESILTSNHTNTEGTFSMPIP